MTATVHWLLAQAGTALAGDEARREAELLLGHALGRDRAWLYAHADDPVSGDDAERFRAFVARRCEGEPLAYITGRREFWSLDLGVSPDVLIPRPETELLVELALARIGADAAIEVADLGTGSGAVALAIARERPLARIVATDASAAALAIARTNAQRLGLGQVRFVEGNWLDPLGQQRFDLVVSNPPYIAEADAHLERGDLRFEPRSALASGGDGLDAIRAIVTAAPRHLHDGGWLLLEHGHEQGAAVRALLAAAGFHDVATTADLERRDRVSMARIAGPPR